MKGWMVWAALGGLVSACALEVEEPGGSQPPGGTLGPPLTPPPGGFGGFGSGGTAAEAWTAGGTGGSSCQDQVVPCGAVGRDPPAGCFSNEDCGAGLCVNGGCQAFCAGDAGCAGGDACVLGLCRPETGRGWECVEQADCADSEDCVAGSCFRRCLRDGHCDVEEERSCSFGYCGLLR